VQVSEDAAGELLGFVEPPPRDSSLGLIESYQIVASQYGSTTLSQVSDYIQSLFSKVSIGFIPILAPQEHGLVHAGARLCIITGFPYAGPAARL
jgi:hypothetical protein